MTIDTNDFNPFPQKECREFCDRRKWIVVEERGIKYTGVNRYEKLFAVFKVDFCLISDGLKCDFLIVDCDDKIGYFIELKGSELSHALKQIERSIELLKKNLGCYAICGRIVLGKNAPTKLRGSKDLKLRKKIKELNKQRGIKFEGQVLGIDKEGKENL